MIESVEWLRTFISFHPSFDYLIMFFGVAFGGEFVILILGFLVARGLLDPLPFLMLIFWGTFLSNILWFLLGKTKVLTKIISHRYADPTISTIMLAINKMSKGNYLIDLIIIKFLVGTPVTLTMYINKTGLKWKDFFWGELLAIFLSLLVLAPIGIASGFGFIYLAKAFDNLHVAISFIVLVVFLLVVAQIWLKKKLTNRVNQ